jgi:DNA-binding CsgD family transcriptional regulator
MASFRLTWRSLALLGIAPLFTGFLVLVKTESPFAAIAPLPSVLLFVRGCLFSLIAFALVVLLVRAVFSSRYRAWGKRQLVFLALAGFAETALACLLLSFALGGAFVPKILFVISGVLFGMGCSLLIGLWGLIYANLVPENALFLSAIALILASALYSLCSLPWLFEHPQLYSLLLLALSVLLYVFSLRILPGIATDSIEFAAHDTVISDEAETFVDTGSTISAAIRAILRTLWKPLVGAILGAFVSGLVWDPVPAGEAARSSTTEGSLLSLLAPLLAAVLVIAALLLRPKAFTLHVFCEVVMPIAIGILLVIPYMGLDQFIPPLLPYFISEMCFAMIVLAVWASMAAGVRTADLNAWVVFTTGCGLLAAAFLLGLFAIHLIGLGGKLLCLLLFTLFLLSMIIDFVLQGRPQNRSRELQRDVFERFLRQRCEKLSAEHGLSNREQEVFIYLARGYSHVFIAKELYVSENTIRTHVKHIYTKLSLNSLEELICLIDAEEDSATEPQI